MDPKLPYTGMDIFRLPLKEWVIFNSTIAYRLLTGTWRYPVPASGDLETMKRRDIIYWMYKARFPVRKAWKGSGLEDFFKKQSKAVWGLPAGFVAEEELSMSSVGDLMDHPFLPASSDRLYDGVADRIFGADFCTANLECVVSPDGAEFVIKLPLPPPLVYRKPNFDAAKGPSGRRYSFMSTARNHSLDGGEAGVASTIQALRSEGIAFNGINETELDSERGTIVSVKGFKLGLISWTFGLNAYKPPADKPWIVNRTHLNGRVEEVDLARMERQLAFCTQNGVDLVIAQLHWGMEHEYYPRPEQLEVAHRIAELGADVIIGHHPHVVQPMEVYRTQRDPDRNVPIYYSLGNLINPFSHPEFRTGGLARLQLTRGRGADGKRRTYVRSAVLEKTFQELDTVQKRLRLVPYEKS